MWNDSASSQEKGKIETHPSRIRSTSRARKREQRRRGRTDRKPSLPHPLILSPTLVSTHSRPGARGDPAGGDRHRAGGRGSRIAARPILRFHSAVFARIVVLQQDVVVAAPKRIHNPLFPLTLTLNTGLGRQVMRALYHTRGVRVRGGGVIGGERGGEGRGARSAELLSPHHTRSGRGCIVVSAQRPQGGRGRRLGGRGRNVTPRLLTQPHT